jgi:hypothetical protein
MGVASGPLEYAGFLRMFVIPATIFFMDGNSNIGTLQTGSWLLI